MFEPVRYPAEIEPLVRFVEETAPEDIVAEATHLLRSGTPAKQMLLASGLAVVRSSDLPSGHHGGPLHPLMGVHALHHAADRLSGDYAILPIVQGVALASRHIHAPSMGPFILPEAKPISRNGSVDETLEAIAQHVRRGAPHTCDHYFLFLLEQLSPIRLLEQLLEIGTPKNQIDDHNFLVPIYIWRALEIFGWEYAPALVRTVVRYVTRPPAPPEMLEDALIEEYGLLERELRFETGEDETPALEALRDEIGRCDVMQEVPGILARALADGVSVHGVAEGLSAGGSVLFLRTLTANPMDIHIHTGANARRYLLRQPELSLRAKLRALLTWNNGPEVNRAWRNLPPDPQPERERVEALPTRGQDALLDEIEDVIAGLPVERRRLSQMPYWKAEEGVKHAVALAQQYVDLGYEPDALHALVGRLACRDNFTEMHAFKHHQATYEEYCDTRPALRSTHLVSAVFGAAISHGHIHSVYEDAVGVMEIPGLSKPPQMTWERVDGI